VPLAAHSAECHVSLLESKAKVGKLLAEFLASSFLAAHGAVLIGRAETLAHDPIHRAQYDTVVSRAVAALPVLIELGVPFLDEGGELWCWKSSLDELVDSERALAELNATPVRALRYRLPSEDHDRFVIALRRTGGLPGRYPRKEGIPSKRPLGGRATSK
jgi:16S rRNA (guanine527-N7)-methyltransferase